MSQSRIGKDGHWAKVGDIVEVVKGRKYPIGLRMVVADFQDGYCYWQSAPNSGRYACACNGREIVFVDEGFTFGNINDRNVKIVAVTEDRDTDPAYANVSKYHYDRWGDFVLDKGIKTVDKEE